MSTKRHIQIAGYIASIFLFSPIFLAMAFGPAAVSALREYYFWGLTLAMFIFAIPFVLQARASHKWVNEAEERRGEDVTTDNYQPTRNATLLINQLHELGFTRLGETLSPLDPSTVALTWMLTNPDHTDFVEVVDLQGKLPAMLQFSTIFADEAVLETAYPIGKTKDFPQYRSRFNPVSVNAAYDQHTLDRFRMESEHGAPRPIESVADYLHWEERYRELYSHNNLRGTQTGALINAALIMGMCGFMLVFAMTESNLIPEGIGMTIAAVAIAVIIIGATIFLIFSRSARQLATAAEHFKKRQDKAARPRRRIF